MVRPVLTAASILANVLEEPKDPVNTEVSKEQNIETDSKLIHFST